MANTSTTTNIQHYGSRKVPIDVRIVDKLRNCVMHSHSLRSRFNALNQCAQQMSQRVSADEREVKQLIEQQRSYRPDSVQHAEYSAKIATLDARIATASSECEQIRAEARDWANRASPINEMVRGVLRELKVGAADLAIDIVDFDERAGGASRGGYTGPSL